MYSYAMRAGCTSNRLPGRWTSYDVILSVSMCVFMTQLRRENNNHHHHHYHHQHYRIVIIISIVMILYELSKIVWWLHRPCVQQVQDRPAWGSSQFLITLNTNVNRGLDMCEVCTQVVGSSYRGDESTSTHYYFKWFQGPGLSTFVVFLWCLLVPSGSSCLLKFILQNKSVKEQRPRKLHGQALSPALRQNEMAQCKYGQGHLVRYLSKFENELRHSQD